jgi:gliding motility-associated protein GldC
MKSNITVEITLNEDKMPEQIEWVAPGGGVETPQKAKAILLGLWDGQDKSALRIDLWTTKMMVDEMNDFFFQTLMGMADTYQRATKNEELAAEMKAYAKKFMKQAADALEQQP